MLIQTYESRWSAQLSYLQLPEDFRRREDTGIQNSGHGERSSNNGADLRW